MSATESLYCPKGEYMDSVSKTLDFKAFCFEIYRAHHKLTGKEAMGLFKQFGVLRYLNDYYGSLHSQGGLYLIEDIDLYIKARKGA